MKKLKTMKEVYDIMLDNRCMINGRYVKTMGDVFEVVDELITAEGENRFIMTLSEYNVGLEGLDDKEVSALEKNLKFQIDIYLSNLGYVYSDAEFYKCFHNFVSTFKQKIEKERIVEQYDITPAVERLMLE